MYIGAITPGDRPALAWLQALYWTVTTIATIGYGDIVPDRTSALQLGYMIMAELVGVGMFGFIIGNIASLIANLESAKAQHRGKMEVVGTFIRERSLPRDLARRMTAYYDYLWETRRGGGGEELLEELPAALRTEVALYLNRELIE